VGIILNQSGTFSGATNVTGTFTGSLGAIDGAQPYSTAGQTVTLAVVNCPDPGDHIPDPSESAAETAGDRIVCVRINVIGVLSFAAIRHSHAKDVSSRFCHSEK
jgi:hypothetical protein